MSNLLDKRFERRVTWVSVVTPPPAEPRYCVVRKNAHDDCGEEVARFHNEQDARLYSEWLNATTFLSPVEKPKRVCIQCGHMEVTHATGHVCEGCYEYLRNEMPV